MDTCSAFVAVLTEIIEGWSADPILNDLSSLSSNSIVVPPCAPVKSTVPPFTSSPCPPTRTTSCPSEVSIVSMAMYTRTKTPLTPPDTTTSPSIAVTAVSFASTIVVFVVASTRNLAPFKFRHPGAAMPATKTVSPGLMLWRVVVCTRTPPPTISMWSTIETSSPTDRSILLAVPAAQVPGIVSCTANVLPDKLVLAVTTYLSDDRQRRNKVYPCRTSSAPDSVNVTVWEAMLDTFSTLAFGALTLNSTALSNSILAESLDMFASCKTTLLSSIMALIKYKLPSKDAMPESVTTTTSPASSLWPGTVKRAGLCAVAFVIGRPTMAAVCSSSPRLTSFLIVTRRLDVNIIGSVSFPANTTGPLRVAVRDTVSMASMATVSFPVDVLRVKRSGPVPALLLTTSAAFALGTNANRPECRIWIRLAAVPSMSKSPCRTKLFPTVEWPSTVISL